MVRRALYLALASALTPLPVQAKIFNVGISAYVSGYSEISQCQGPMTPSCFQPFARSISLDLGQIDLQEGANAITYGYRYSIGEYDFTLIRSGDFLSGTNLFYGFQSCSNPPPPGCRFDFGTAPTFAVSGGVPEPGAWTMMLMGFGAIGIALRRRSRQPWNAAMNSECA